MGNQGKNGKLVESRRLGAREVLGEAFGVVKGMGKKG